MSSPTYAYFFTHTIIIFRFADQLVTKLFPNQENELVGGDEKLLQFIKILGEKHQGKWMYIEHQTALHFVLKI
jgi:hypothetical protein